MPSHLLSGLPEVPAAAHSCPFCPEQVWWHILVILHELGKPWSQQVTAPGPVPQFWGHLGLQFSSV